MLRTALKQISREVLRLQLVHQHPTLSCRSSVWGRFLATSPKCLVFDRTEQKIPEIQTLSTLTDADDLTSTIPFIHDDPCKLDNKRLNRQAALQLLHDELFISKEAGEKIFAKEPKLRFINKANFSKVVEIIKTFKIESPTVSEFPWILAIPSYNLRAKLETISQMKPKKIDDFIPLLRASNFRLVKILCLMENERDITPEGNRIYYLSKKLDMPPKTVCKYIAPRLFMLEIPLQTLIASLDAMLEYGISPNSIIRDLWAFRYNTQSIRERLERARKAHKTKLMPWMIRCPEPILQRSLRLAADEKEILGDNDVYDYLSERLGYDIETTKAIVSKHPAVARVRVTKIKEILDYLLNEAGFTRYDIAQVPRILSHGLETTRQRLEELKSYGCRPTTLVIVCKSKREYQKFVDKWLETKRKIKMQ